MPQPPPRIFLSTGSNLGDREKNLLRAEALLVQSACTIVQRSAIVESAPWGVEDQPSFLNRVLEVRTDLPPVALLKLLQQIERAMGRRRRRNWGERLIDLDLLMYGDRVMQDPELTLPHARMAERNFVLRPLAEIAPETVHPVLGKTIAELAAESPDALWVRPWDEDVPKKP